jgi:hypothetical protein
MGMLAAWVVWLIFRWFASYISLSLFSFMRRKKIPRECKSQRNCQLVMVSAAIAFTVRPLFPIFILICNAIFPSAGLLLHQVCGLGCSLWRHYTRTCHWHTGSFQRAGEPLYKGAVYSLSSTLISLSLTR